MTLAEKIAAKNARLVAIKDRLTELKGLSETDDAYDYSEEEQTEMGVLAEETDGVVKSIESLEKMESALKAKAVPIKTSHYPDHKTAPKADLIVKEAVCSLVGFCENKSAEQVAHERYPDHKMDLGVMRNKSAASAADTTTAGYAAELIQTQYSGFMDLLAPVSVFAALASRGTSVDLTNGPVTFPARTADVRATPSFVGEGGAIPVGAISLSSKVMSPYKMGIILAMTREIVQQSNPSIEAIVRKAIIDDTALKLDSAFLDASAAVAGVRPAGIIYNVTGVASSGDTVANILTDIKVALSPMTLANMGAKPVILLNSNTVLALSLIPNSVGGFPFRDELSASGTLMGIPVISSTTLDPTKMIALDSSDFGYGLGSPSFTTSESATIVMANGDVSAPTMSLDGSGGIGTAEETKPDSGISVTGGETGLGTAGAQAISLFQTNTIAIREILPVSWLEMRTGSLEMITGISW